MRSSQYNPCLTPRSEEEDGVSEQVHHDCRGRPNYNSLVPGRVSESLNLARKHQAHWNFSPYRLLTSICCVLQFAQRRHRGSTKIAPRDLHRKQYITLQGRQVVNMDKGGASAAVFASRDLSQIGQENPRVPTSPGLDYDELFRSVFDWDLYCDSTRSQDYPGASSSPRLSYRDLPSLITDIPSFLDHLSLDRSEAEYLRMTPGLSPDDGGITTSESMGQTPPELVRGGSTSPSSHSGSVFFDGVDDVRRRPRVSLQEVQAQDDKWTYPQAVPSKHAPRGYGYPHQIQVHESSSRRSGHTKTYSYSPSSNSTSGVKRQRSVEKRSRQLSDPDQTADVRKSGACLPCRISKTRVRKPIQYNAYTRPLPLWKKTLN